MANFNGKGAPSFAQGPKGLADMLASALRGGVKATLGMPGDVERMGRMGINALGGNVDTQAALPTTEDWDKRLPPVNPMTGQNFNQVEKLGEFLPINAAGPVMGAAGKANSAVQALRQSAPAATNMGRRTALKGIGAVGAGAAVAPELIVQALRSIPATPAATGAVGKSVAGAAAKVSTQALKAALAKTLGDVHLSHGSAKFERVVKPEEMVDMARAYLPDLPEDQLLRGLNNAAGLYEQAGGVRNYGDVGFDKIAKELNLADDVDDYDLHGAVYKAILEGRLNPKDFSQEALRDLSMSEHPLSDVINSMSGVSLKLDNMKLPE